MDPSLYLDRDTWVHRLDPRTKMFLLVGMFALPFVFLNPLYELAVLALVLFFGYLAQALTNLRRIWFILLTILIVTTLLWSIVGSGQTPLFLFVARESKGVGARPKRTSYLRTAMSGRDALIIVGFIVLLAGCIALRMMGYGGL